MKHIFFLGILWIAAYQSVYGNGNATARFNSLTAEIDACAFSRATMAKMMIVELHTISKKYPENTLFAVQALLYEARVNSLHGVSDSALTVKVQDAINTWNVGNHSLEQALLSNTLALCHFADGNYTKAFAGALQSLEQLQKLEHTLPYMVKLLYLLGNICLKTHNVMMTVDYYRQALALSTPEQKEYRSIRVALYTYMANMDSGKHCIDSLELLVPQLKQQRDTALLITACFNMGTLLINRGEMDRGYHYYLMSRDYANKHRLDNHAFTFMSQHNLSAINSLRGEYSEAFRCAWAAKEAAGKSRNQEQMSMICSLLSSLHSAQGNTDSAYCYLVRHNALQQEFIGKSKTIEVYKDYISMYLDSAQKELAAAEQKMVIRRRLFILMAVLALATISVIVLLLAIARQKKYAAEKRIEQEQQIQELQKEKIEMQVRQLTSYSVLLSNKNHSFGQISELVRQLPASGQKETAELKKRVLALIESDLNSDNEKKNFMLHFDTVHPSFFEKLKARAGDLTEHNLHLCAYFRIGMSSKQIAQILNVSFDTIRINRYRLRKKLGLTEDEDLYDFLRNM